jgi:hypothetical protein
MGMGAFVCAFAIPETLLAKMSRRVKKAKKGVGGLAPHPTKYFGKISDLIGKDTELHYYWFGEKLNVYDWAWHTQTREDNHMSLSPTEVLKHEVGPFRYSVTVSDGKLEFDMPLVKFEDLQFKGNFAKENIKNLKSLLVVEFDGHLNMVTTEIAKHENLYR